MRPRDGPRGKGSVSLRPSHEQAVPHTQEGEGSAGCWGGRRGPRGLRVSVSQLYCSSDGNFHAISHSEQEGHPARPPCLIQISCLFFFLLLIKTPRSFMSWGQLAFSEALGTLSTGSGGGGQGRGSSPGQGPSQAHGREGAGGPRVGSGVDCEPGRDGRVAGGTESSESSCEDGTLTGAGQTRASR